MPWSCDCWLATDRSYRRLYCCRLPLHKMQAFLWVEHHLIRCDRHQLLSCSCCWCDGNNRTRDFRQATPCGMGLLALQSCGLQMLLLCRHGACEGKCSL